MMMTLKRVALLAVVAPIVLYSATINVNPPPVGSRE
jgi:hypothetical protein